MAWPTSPHALLADMRKISDNLYWCSQGLVKLDMVDSDKVLGEGRSCWYDIGSVGLTYLTGS